MERHLFLILGEDGEPAFVAPELYGSHIEDGSWVDDVRTYGDGDDPLALVEEVAGDRDIGGGAAAVVLGDRAERRGEDVDGEVSVAGGRTVARRFGVRLLYLTHPLGGAADGRRHPLVDIPKPNTSTERLRELLAEPDEPFVVILDEIAGLGDTDLLVDLAEIEWLSLILIGHRRSTALAQVPDTVDYLRYSEIVEFDAYDDDALFDIRRAVALETGVVDDGQLDRIIDEAGGSARFGVQSLRSGVDLAIERGHTTVGAEDVDDCFEHAHARIREQQLQTLSRDHHIVYEVIREDGPLRPQSVFERYADRTSDPSTRQMVTKYRKKLDEYGLIDVVGRSPSTRRSGRCCGSNGRPKS